MRNSRGFGWRVHRYLRPVKALAPITAAVKIGIDHSVIVIAGAGVHGKITLLVQSPDVVSMHALANPRVRSWELGLECIGSGLRSSPWAKRPANPFSFSRPCSTISAARSQAAPPLASRICFRTAAASGPARASMDAVQPTARNAGEQDEVHPVPPCGEQSTVLVDSVQGSVVSG